MAGSEGDWLNFAGHCISDAGWQVAAKTPEVVLSHRSCPWGGHLIKVESKNVFVQNAPKDPCDVFVRPEVQAMSEGQKERRLKCMEIHAPGDALVEQTNTMWIIRFAAVLFGHCMGPSFQQRFYNKMPVVSRQRIYKDFPEPGNCLYFEQESLWIARPLPDLQSHFCVLGVFSTPAATWPPWASAFLLAFAIMFRKAVDRCLNGPGFRDMRAIDANMYMVLSIRSFTRGHPMIPQSEPCSQGLVTVSTGLKLGLVSWTEFNPGENFYLSEYLQCLMAHLGHKMKTYNVMDGRRLVRYQCVVVRREWDVLKNSFFDAFRVQKAAYRHANGGTAAPTLVEDASPHWDRQVCHELPAPQKHDIIIKTTVRKTFVEIDEDSKDCPKRSNSFGILACFA